MFRMPKRKENRYTTPDHRPMIPEFRTPEDPVAEVMQEARRRRQDMVQNSYRKWR